MKLLLLTLLFSFSASADFVFMKESPTSKNIQLKKHSDTRTVNETNLEQWALYPDISADARLVVYAEGRDEKNLHLTLRDLLKNSSVRFHHPHPGMVLHPKLTRNGRFIFYSAPSLSGKNNIYFFDHDEVVKRQGNFVVDYHLQPQALVPDEEAYFPRPSSDGAFVVYQRNNQGKKEIVLFDRVENKKTVLAEGMSPALSVDERFIAFTSRSKGSWDIYQVDRFTGKIEQLTSDPNNEMAPVYKANGHLVFASDRQGNFRLYEKTSQGEKELVSERDLSISHYSPQFSGETSFKQSLKAPYLGEARSSFGTIVHEGKLYMAGGHMGNEHTYPPESFSDQFLVYDLQTNKWKELAPRPHKAHGFQLAAFGNYVYAFGGFAYSSDHKPRWKSLDAIDRYDILKNEWQTIARLHSPRSSNVAVTIEDKVYIVGGWDSTPQKENDFEGRFKRDIEIFDLRTEEVKLASYQMPLPLRRALTGISHEGKILLIAGLGEGSTHFELLNNVTAIDPATGSSQELTPLPFATFAPAAGIIKNELFVFGGMFQTGEMNYEYVSHIYGMDFTKKQWRHTGRSLSETKGFSQVFNLNNKTLGVLGGHRYFEGFDSPVLTFETFAK